MKCEFRNFTQFACVVKNQKIPSNGAKLIFLGEHKDGKSNHDVKDLCFLNCEMPQIPQTIGQIFKKIELILFHNFFINCTFSLF